MTDTTLTQEQIESIKFREFHNALRIMTNIDRDELERAGIIAANDHNAWGTFARDPYRWMIRASDEKAEKLFYMIQSRQPK